jgi:L1 cell adhesion molecule like protein
MLEEEKMKTALGADANVVEETIKEALAWLETEHTKEEYDEKHKEVEGKLMPLVQKAYQANMPQNAQSAQDTQGVPSSTDEPKSKVDAEEVD